MPPKRISILGVGLLGGSIGLAAKRKIKDCKVSGYGHRRVTLQAALSSGAIDDAFDSPLDAVRESDLIILCTPVSTLGEILRIIGPALRAEAVVTDVGSTKRTVVEAGEQLIGAGVRFVGSHPIAGSEKRGVEFARADLFDDALCILTPTPRTDQWALETVESFWQILGMRTARLSPEEHDRRLAEVSHLPHALAAALVTAASDASLALAGRGFFDLTRIAGGDGGLWRDIFLDNRDNLRANIDRLKRELDTLSDLLEPEKAQELRAWLDHAVTRRGGSLSLEGEG